MPPSTVQQAFILNLPVGEYDIRFLTSSGEVMEGSERRIVTFEKRRAEAVGMEVIPGDKWTRPVESTSPGSVLYVDGSTDLYLRPFYQQEYNDLFYEKLRRNDAKGNPGLMKWVRIQQVPGAALSVGAGAGRSRAVEPRMVQEEPFFVEQIPGGALGYRIVPFDPEGAHRGREPSLRAFRLPVSARQPVLRLRVLDRAGEVLPSSDRQVRIVTPSTNGLAHPPAGRRPAADPGSSARPPLPPRKAIVAALFDDPHLGWSRAGSNTPVVVVRGLRASSRCSSASVVVMLIGYVQVSERRK